MAVKARKKADGYPQIPSLSWGDVLRRALRNPQLHLGIIVLVPTLIWYVVLELGPVVETIWFTLYHVDISGVSSWADLIHSSYWVGLLHFQHLFDPTLNPQFWPGTLHSVIWTVLQFVYILPLGLLMAVMLAKISHGRTLYQIAILVPFVTPTVSAALMMGKIFDPVTGGVNNALRALGLPTSQWLQDPTIALPLAAAIGAWRWVGFYTIIMTAGILNIPKDIDEAAKKLNWGKCLAPILVYYLTAAWPHYRAGQRIVVGQLHARIHPALYAHRRHAAVFHGRIPTD